MAAEVMMTGTFKGTWELSGRTIPPTGQHEFKWTEFARVNPKGLIAELRDYMDPADLLKQL